MNIPTILIVPGLRDHVEQHWQTLLEKDLPKFRTVPAMGREDLDCAKRIAAIEAEARSIDGPIVVVAHSGGCVMVAHWAQRTSVKVTGCLMATPPDFEKDMPAGYPTLAQLQAGGWLPVPRKKLPFPTIVAASRNDPLARMERVEELAADWGASLVDLGEVGHLNPASGYGPWPRAHQLIARLALGKA